MVKVAKRKFIPLSATIAIVTVLLVSLLLLSVQFNWHGIAQRILAGKQNIFGQITEEALLEIAQKPIDVNPDFNEPTVWLGYLRGTDVVLKYHCEDLCPASTVKILRFDLAKGEKCSDVGGIEKAMFVGGWSGMRTYCFPEILVENWESYQRFGLGQ